MLILGLLISGVLVASKMVASAKLRKVIKERDQLEQAILDFKVQYGALPGSQKIYEEIKDYPEFGAVGNYYNMLSYPHNAIPSTFVNANKNNVISTNLVMPANGMLQMNRSSNGAYPGITATSVVENTSNANFQQSSYSGAYWSYGYAGYLPTTGASWLGWVSSTIEATAIAYGNNQAASVPSNIASFINSHFIILSNGAMAVDPNFSVNDSITLSKKYDTGKPNGEKMNFSPPRNTTGTCTTTTSSFGNLSTQIGPNTAFKIDANRGIANRGCIIVFRTAIDG